MIRRRDGSERSEKYSAAFSKIPSHSVALGLLKLPAPVSNGDECESVGFDVILTAYNILTTAYSQLEMIARRVNLDHISRIIQP